jgi:hypothetical protein
MLTYALLNPESFSNYTLFRISSVPFIQVLKILVQFLPKYFPKFRPTHARDRTLHVFEKKCPRRETLLFHIVYSLYDTLYRD